jgi:hypothetical protein
MSKEHARFEDAWGSEYIEGIALLSAFHSICTSLEEEYILAYGTLLGSLRHKDLIPWDDDLDVIHLGKVDWTEHKELFEQYGMGVVKNRGYYKVFLKHKKNIGKYKYSWPFLDVFPCAASSDDIQTYKTSSEGGDVLHNVPGLRANFRVKLKEIYPLQETTIGPLILTGPGDAESMLQRIYGNTCLEEAISRNYNHKLERSEKVKQNVPMKDLPSAMVNPSRLGEDFNRLLSMGEEDKNKEIQSMITDKKDNPHPYVYTVEDVAVPSLIRQDIGYVTICDAKWMPYIEQLIRTHNRYCSYPLEVYTIGFNLEVVSDKCTAIRLEEVGTSFAEICYAKYEAALSCDFSGAMLLDGDTVFGPQGDMLLEDCVRRGADLEYPLCSRHPTVRRGRRGISHVARGHAGGIGEFIGKPLKQDRYPRMEYVHANYFFSNKSRPFLEEAYVLSRELNEKEYYPRHWDESVLNYLLAYKGASVQLPYTFTDSYKHSSTYKIYRYLDNNSELLTSNGTAHKLNAVFHGMKHRERMRKAVDDLIEAHPVPIYEHGSIEDLQLALPEDEPDSFFEGKISIVACGEKIPNRVQDFLKANDKWAKDNDVELVIVSSDPIDSEGYTFNNVLYPKGKEVFSIARYSNYGVRNCSGEVILKTDIDMVLTDEHLHKLRSSIKEDNALIWCTHSLPHRDPELARESSGKNLRRGAFGGGIAMHRKAWQLSGGMNEDMYGYSPEDKEMKVHLKRTFGNKAVMVYDPPMLHMKHPQRKNTKVNPRKREFRVHIWVPSPYRKHIEEDTDIWGKGEYYALYKERYGLK